MNNVGRFFVALLLVGVVWVGTAAQQTVRLYDPCSYSTGKTSEPINIASATTTQEIAAVSGEYAYICAIHLVTATANNVALVEDDTAACASPTAGMAGGTTAATGWNLSDNGGLTLGNGIGTVVRTATTNRYVCLITSGAGQVSGTVVYVTEP